MCERTVLSADEIVIDDSLEKALELRRDKGIYAGDSNLAPHRALATDMNK